MQPVACNIVRLCCNMLSRVGQTDATLCNMVAKRTQHQPASLSLVAFHHPNLPLVDNPVFHRTCRSRPPSSLQANSYTLLEIVWQPHPGRVHETWIPDDQTRKITGAIIAAIVFVVTTIIIIITVITATLSPDTTTCIRIVQGIVRRISRLCSLCNRIVFEKENDWDIRRNVTLV